MMSCSDVVMSTKYVFIFCVGLAMTQGGKAVDLCLSLSAFHGCYMYEVNAYILKVQPLLLVMSRVQKTL